MFLSFPKRGCDGQRMIAFFNALMLLSFRMVAASKKSSAKLLIPPRLAEPSDRLTRRLINPLRGMLKGPRDNPAPKFVASGTTRNLKFLAAGAIAGVVSRTLVSPLEVVATINMAAVGSVEGPRDSLMRLWAVEGLAGFYKGNGANCLKVAPTKGIQFVSFEFFKRQILMLKRWHNMPEILEPVERLIAGGFALCSATCSSATLCFWSVGWHDRCSLRISARDCEILTYN